MAKNDPIDLFESNLKRALMPLVVLSVLKERPMYIYEITQTINRYYTTYDYSNALYPVIYRLLESSFVELSHEERVGKRIRTYYKITQPGIEYLAAATSKLKDISKITNQLFFVNDGTM